MTKPIQELKTVENMREMKDGQYLLTPLEAILINKKMPYGIKLDTEENILQSLEISRQNAKKSERPKSKRYETSDLFSNENSYNQPRKARERKANTDNIQMRTNIANNKVLISKKCEKGLIKIRQNPLSEQFYLSSSSDIPSLSIIERKIKNNKYETIGDFTFDLRNLWSFYFQNYTSNPDPDLYQKVLKLSQISEEISKELQNCDDNGNSNLKEIHKKITNLQRDVKDIKGNQYGTHHPNKKVENSVSMMDKELTSQEKTQLSNNIRSLPPDQLVGIVNILSNTKELEVNKSHLEFDIEKLPVRLLRELERYTNNCLKNHPPKGKTPEDAQKSRTDLNQRKGINPKQHNANPAQSQSMSQPLNLKKDNASIIPINETVLVNNGNINTHIQQESKKIVPEDVISKKKSNILNGTSSDMDSISSNSSSSINSDFSSD